MASEPDDDLDDGPFHSPLPQDDRIWRHPSELGDEADLPSQRSRPWAALLARVRGRSRAAS